MTSIDNELLSRFIYKINSQFELDSEFVNFLSQIFFECIAHYCISCNNSDNIDRKIADKSELVSKIIKKISSVYWLQPEFVSEVNQMLLECFVPYCISHNYSENNDGKTVQWSDTNSDSDSE